jgi:Protein of unknown function (DUF1549)/Protein of unknown function (DUF1553)
MRTAALLIIVLVGASHAESPADLAQKIDAAVAARLQSAGVTSAPRADDAEFLRRIYLDVAGRIPSLSEARAFLDDRASDKRKKLLEKLLKDPRHAEHFTNVWRALLLPEQSVDVLQNNTGFEQWMRKQIEANTPYDRWVRELLTVPFAAERVQSKAMKRDEINATPSTATPEAYYLAKDAKPESLAAATARVFLGVRIECAQCHDHPGGHWSRQQFWSYAAFFAGLSRDREGGGVREVFDKREMTIPGSSQVIEAEFLDGGIPQWKFNVGSRVTLADWVTSPENPYFAKAAVNRLWAHFFGVGLVEPEDDLRKDNPPSHPELLDELARQFVAQKFDVQFLIRAVVLSDAYQRTSAHTNGSTMPRHFDRLAIKRLTPEQLFDSLAQATGYREPAPARDGIPAVYRGGARSEFLALFASAGAPRTDVQLSIPQALALMNGPFTAGAMATKNDLIAYLARTTGLDATVGSKATFLAETANNPNLDVATKIETLFLATLTRRPTAAEMEQLTKRPLTDIFWALLNSTEFCVNH